MQKEELVALRKEAGYKSYQLADAIGICAATLSRYERGHKPIPPLVELSVRYLCEPRLAPQTAEQRLVEAIKEVVSK